MVGKVAELLARNAALEKETLHLRERSNSLTEKVERLQAQLDYYLARTYGPRSERFEQPGQLDFFPNGGLEVEDATKETESPADAERVDVSYTRRRGKKKGPAPIPEHLRRERVEWDPDPAYRTCACCNEAMDRVEEVVTEELSVTPPEFFVRQFVRGKFRCTKCMNRSIEKPLPPRPIERGRPSPSLLAYIVVSKYVDHLPLHRQEQIYKRIGYDLSRQTMDGWLGPLAELLFPIVKAMEKRLLGGSYLQIDETPIRYLAEEKKGKAQQGYLWAVTRPREEIVYHFTTSRSGAHPRRFLAGFRGKLQTDGYAGYDALVSEGITLLACLAHIRPGFYEGRCTLPEAAGEILAIIEKLYEIERRREEVDDAAFEVLRMSSSLPLATTLRAKIDRIGDAVLPSSKLGKAASYARNMWSRFEITVATPEARLDNNWVENGLRPGALGRKNWLFLGSAHGGGRRLEAFLSLAQSCRRLGANPFEYFVDVIERVSAWPYARIEELTPRGWMAARGIPLASERSDSRMDSEARPPRGDARAPAISQIGRRPTSLAPAQEELRGK